MQTAGCILHNLRLSGRFFALFYSFLPIYALLQARITFGETKYFSTPPSRYARHLPLSKGRLAMVEIYLPFPFGASAGQRA